jgi:hypothetical protein
MIGSSSCTPVSRRGSSSFFTRRDRACMRGPFGPIHILSVQAGQTLTAVELGERRQAGSGEPACAPDSGQDGGARRASPPTFSAAGSSKEPRHRYPI